MTGLNKIKTRRAFTAAIVTGFCLFLSCGRTIIDGPFPNEILTYYNQSGYSIEIKSYKANIPQVFTIADKDSLVQQSDHIGSGFLIRNADSVYVIFNDGRKIFETIWDINTPFRENSIFNGKSYNLTRKGGVNNMDFYFKYSFTGKDYQLAK